MDEKAVKARQSVEKLRAEIGAGVPGGLYILHGEERYLRDRTLESLRATIPDAASGFNYRRFEWKSAEADDIFAAVNTPPAFSERTLVEVRDYDMFGADEGDRRTLCEMFEDLPEYVCLVFVYDTLEYKPDGRTALGKAVKKCARVVEFGAQEETRLIKWIAAHFKRLGKTIDAREARYLLELTDGYMAGLNSEIGKLSAYARSDSVTRADIDDIVTPSPEAFSYQMTDAMTRGDYDAAAGILDTLLRMREPPQKLIFIISLKMRQLLAARVCAARGLSSAQLSDLCGIKFEFQARGLLSAARRVSLDECRAAVLCCAQTAYAMNSGGDGEDELIKLLARLALRRPGAAAG
ncbi:MAG: DNA polymerase III subunit delta [Oscillospiraceae bacterium]|jgi:DNA polymerase-3 subunit delta|nr:DNA polymerase III subunit delta [Oscillospiraceae bacterium]